MLRNEATLEQAVTARPAIDPRTHRNPVFEGTLADPFVFRHAGVYYAVGTGPAGSEGAMQFPMLRSDNFFDWHPSGHGLLTPQVEGRHFWAPEVAYRTGKFYMYYSVGDEGHTLRVATSRTPEGPYVDTGTPLLDPESALFAIDPHPFRDVDGTWYLYYARDFPDQDGPDRSGTALAVGRLLSMTRLSTEYRVVLRARHDWQRYEKDRLMYDSVRDWHTLEGPSVVRRDGRYYCLYSGGNWQNASYGVDFAVGDSPLGPFRNSGKAPRVLRSIAGKRIGPGHNSLVTGPDGGTYIAYHAWDPAMTARHMCLSPLHWTPDGPAPVELG